MNLEPGEYVCKKCKGSGFFCLSINKPIKQCYVVNCHIEDCTCECCNGTGKVDWIQEILNGE